MADDQVNHIEDDRSTGLLSGLNTLEKCLTLSEEYGDL